MAIVAVAAFLLGRSSVNVDMSDMEEQLEEYRAKAMEATVVNRVSQQMEDIAYQQKEISDRQRDRAEEQSLLAIAERERAEKESQAARLAEGKAMDALKEAEHQRTIAVEQEGIAREQLVQTQLQKSITDTLSFRTLGRSLGAASISQYELGNKRSARQLAYASWYFIDKYKGNSYQMESFKSLVLSSEQMRRYTMAKRGTVSGVVRIPGGADGCIAISKYGEIERWENVSKSAESTLLYHNRDYDFRDVELAADGTIWALSLHGPLCALAKNGRMTVYELPEDSYFNIIRVSEQTYMLVGRRSVTWFDTQNRRTGTNVTLPYTLSTVCMRGSFLEMYYDNGKYGEMTIDGKLKEKKAPMTGVVTAACYDKVYGNHFYGMKDGSIAACGRNGETMSIVGHVAAVTDIDIDDNILVTSSYDKTVLIWNLTRMQIGKDIDFGQGKQTSTIGNEWLIPVDYRFDGWPLCVSLDREHDYLWVGTSSGTVQRIPYAVGNLAKMYRSTYKSSLNMSEDEWRKNIGVTVPYVRFVRE